MPIHFHHIAGMGGGYIPDDHGLYDTFEQAISSVEGDIAREGENGDDVPVRTYERIGYEPNDRLPYAYWVGYYSADDSPHDLGWYFEVFGAEDDTPDHEDCRAILNGEKEYPLV